MNHIEVDLRTVYRDKTVFVPCPKCGRVLPIRYDSVTKCNCGIEICRSDDLTKPRCETKSPKIDVSFADGTTCEV